MVWSMVEGLGIKLVIWTARNMVLLGTILGTLLGVKNGNAVGV